MKDKEMLHLTLSVKGEFFHPGDSIEGEVRIDAPTRWTADYIEVLLLWETEGRGTQDTSKVQSFSLTAKGDEIDACFKAPFRFAAPWLPLTYTGEMLKIHWHVGLYARPKNGYEKFLRQEITIHTEPSLFGFAKVEEQPGGTASLPSVPPPDLPDVPPDATW